MQQALLIPLLHAQTQCILPENTLDKNSYHDPSGFSSRLAKQDIVLRTSPVASKPPNQGLNCNLSLEHNILRNKIKQKCNRYKQSCVVDINSWEYKANTAAAAGEEEERIVLCSQCQPRESGTRGSPRLLYFNWPLLQNIWMATVGGTFWINVTHWFESVQLLTWPRSKFGFPSVHTVYKEMVEPGDWWGKWSAVRFPHAI